MGEEGTLPSATAGEGQDSSPTTVEGWGQLSTVLGHHQDFRRQPRPGTFAWPLMVTWTSDINTEPGFDRTISPDMAPGGSMGLHVPMTSGRSAGHSDQYAPQWQHGAQTSTWSHMVAQTVDFCMAFGGNLGHAN